MLSWMPLAGAPSDRERLSAAAGSFHGEKHHLVYSLGHSAMPAYIRGRVGATGDDVFSATEWLVTVMPGAQYCTGIGKRKVHHSRRC
jgi:hypothetical protein